VAQHLFIVSRACPDLFAYLAREFSSEPDVTVILDRRQGERRRGSECRAAERPDRRRADRRLNAGIVPALSTLGYAFVRLS
jgi:hypothetical protein